MYYVYYGCNEMFDLRYMQYNVYGIVRVIYMSIVVGIFIDTLFDI